MSEKIPERHQTPIAQSNIGPIVSSSRCNDASLFFFGLFANFLFFGFAYVGIQQEGFWGYLSIYWGGVPGESTGLMWGLTLVTLLSWFKVWNLMTHGPTGSSPPHRSRSVPAHEAQRRNAVKSAAEGLKADQSAILAATKKLKAMGDADQGKKAQRVATENSAQQRATPKPADYGTHPLPKAQGPFTVVDDALLKAPQRMAQAFLTEIKDWGIFTLSGRIDEGVTALPTERYWDTSGYYGYRDEHANRDFAVTNKLFGSKYDELTNIGLHGDMGLSRAQMVWMVARSLTVFNQLCSAAAAHEMFSEDRYEFDTASGGWQTPARSSRAMTDTLTFAVDKGYVFLPVFKDIVKRSGWASMVSGGDLFILAPTTHPWLIRVRGSATPKDISIIRSDLMIAMDYFEALYVAWSGGDITQVSKDLELPARRLQANALVEYFDCSINFSSDGKCTILGWSGMDGVLGLKDREKPDCQVL